MPSTTPPSSSPTGCPTGRASSTPTDARSTCRPPVAAGPSRSCATTAITVAALVHDAALGDEPELVQAVAATARLAIQNQRLQAEVRAQLEEVRASRARIVDAGDAERRRIERNLHDGAQQRLVDALRSLLGSPGAGRRATPTRSWRRRSTRPPRAAAALAELRELARGIHPAVLTERRPGPGAGVAGRALADARHRRRRPRPTGCPRRVEATAYYVVSEALANAAKHAHATAVTVSAGGETAALRGRGRRRRRRRRRPRTAAGCAACADRVAALDGRLHVRSPPGEGTRVTAELPCGS